ncbi:hypothetical protein P9112_009200 [Eukaryota sp. TZLM1-RC]
MKFNCFPALSFIKLLKPSRNLVPDIPMLNENLDINGNDRDSEYEKRRADVVVPFFDDVLNVVDIVTVDVCMTNALRNAQSEVSSFNVSELYKRKKYATP